MTRQLGAVLCAVTFAAGLLSASTALAGGNAQLKAGAKKAIMPLYGPSPGWTPELHVVPLAQRGKKLSVAVEVKNWGSAFLHTVNTASKPWTAKRGAIGYRTPKQAMAMARKAVKPYDPVTHGPTVHEDGLSNSGKNYRFAVSFGPAKIATVAIDVPLDPKSSKVRKYRTLEHLQALNPNTDPQKLKRWLPKKGTY